MADEKAQDEHLHTETAAGRPPGDGSTAPTTGLAAEARHAADAEHHMSLRAAVRLYPHAIGWSVLLSSTLIMEGYDLALLSSLYASEAFNRKFGTRDEATGKWALSAAWQSGLSNGARAGEILGLILAGWTADRYGYKVTTIASLVLMILFIFVLFFAPNVQVLVLGEILCGTALPPPAYSPSYAPSLSHSPFFPSPRDRLPQRGGRADRPKESPGAPSSP